MSVFGFVTLFHGYISTWLGDHYEDDECSTVVLSFDMQQGRLAWLGHCTRGPRARVSRTCRVLFIYDAAGCALILHCEFEYRCM